ncbi:MAG TPA: metallophosphoesterase [Opitutaceae bacterium]|nr:metallophosphoesterase [Opitutaceae bacterium]
MPTIDLFGLLVPGELTRVFSDIHYGDRASRVRDLAQLTPLMREVDALVFNGDTMDTRTGPRPQHTEECRRAVVDLVARTDAPVTFLTGNHDPDISSRHWHELAGGEVLVVHGDVLFDDIVPWGRDARLIRERIASAAGTADDRKRLSLDDRLRIWREVAGSIPQRHQSERDPMRYAFHFAVDTIWPPTRFVQIIQAWRTEADRAVALLREQRPRAKYILLGHTHRPTIRRIAGGPIVINTGSFTAPFGGYAVDVASRQLRVRRIQYQQGLFQPGTAVAEFPLAFAGR